MKSSGEALCLARIYSCQHIFESCTQTNNKDCCLSVSKWYLVEVKLNSSQPQIGLFQGFNSNFPTSIPASSHGPILLIPCNFSILCSSHISFFSCLFECSGSLGVIFLHFQVKMNLKNKTLLEFQGLFSDIYRG